MSRRILLVFTSRWMILGLHPVCKYSRPTNIWTCVHTVNWKKKCPWTTNKLHIKPLAASSAIRRRASQSKRFWVVESVNIFRVFIKSFPLQLRRKMKFFLWSMGTRVDRICDRARFHCAYTHKPKYVDVLLHSIQSKEPNFYGEFLTRGLPANMLTC